MQPTDMGTAQPGAKHELHEPAVGVPHLLADGIWQIVLPIPTSLRSVNVYVLHTADEWALIDCGWYGATAQAALQAGLAALDISFADIATLVLTHAHPDHIGTAAAIAAAMPSSGRILVLEREMESLFNYWGKDPAENALVTEGQLLQLGFPADEIAAIAQDMRSAGRTRLAPPRDSVTTLTDGEHVSICERSWRVLWTPGHAPGHMCLVHEQTLISGDHILPKISPNVSISLFSGPNPIQDYLQSLQRIDDLGLVAPLVLPGHRQPFAQLDERIAVLRAETLDRSEKVSALLQQMDEPVSALAIAEKLWHNRLRHWIDRQMAAGESMAHLEYLRAQGKVAREERQGVLYYS